MTVKNIRKVGYATAFGAAASTALLNPGSAEAAPASQLDPNVLNQGINDTLNQAQQAANKAPLPFKPALDNFFTQIKGVVPSNLVRTSGSSRGDNFEAPTTTPVEGAGVHGGSGAVPTGSNNQAAMPAYAPWNASGAQTAQSQQFPTVTPQQINAAATASKIKSQGIDFPAIQHITNQLAADHNGHKDPNTIGQLFGGAEVPTSETINQINKDINDVVHKVTSGEIVGEVRNAIDKTVNSEQVKAWRENTRTLSNIDRSKHGVDRGAEGISHLIDSMSTRPEQTFAELTEAAGGIPNIILHPVDALVKATTAVIGPDIMKQFHDDLSKIGPKVKDSIGKSAPALLAIPAMAAIGSWLTAVPSGLLLAGPAALLGAIPGALLGPLVGAPLLGIPGAILSAIPGLIGGAAMGGSLGAPIGALLGALAPHNIIPGLLSAIPGAFLGGLGSGAVGLLSSLLLDLAVMGLGPLIGAATGSTLGLIALATTTYGLWALTLIPALLVSAGLGVVLGAITMILGVIVSGPAAPAMAGAIIGGGVLVFLFTTLMGTALYALSTAWIPTVAYLLLTPLFVGLPLLLGVGAGLLAGTIFSLLSTPLITGLSALPGALSGAIAGYLLGDGLSRLVSGLVGAGIGALIGGLIGAPIGAAITGTIGGILSAITGAILGSVVGAAITGTLSGIGGFILGLLGGGLLGGLAGGALGALLAAIIGSFLFSRDLGQWAGKNLFGPNSAFGQLQKAMDQGWRRSLLGQIFGTLGNNLNDTETGQIIRDLVHRVNALFSQIAFLDGRRLREMLSRGGILGALLGAPLGIIPGGIPGAIIGALLEAPLGLIPGGIMGALMGAPLLGIPGAILGSLIGGPLLGIPAAILGALNPMNLLNGLVGGLAASIPGAVLGAFGGKMLSMLLGALTAPAVAALSFLPILIGLSIPALIGGTILSLLALGAAIIPPLVIATAVWIVLSLAISAPLWIPTTIISTGATIIAFLSVGASAWSAITVALAPVAAALAPLAAGAGAVATTVAIANVIIYLSALGIGLFTIFPITFLIALPFFIFPALGVPLALLLSSPFLIPAAAGLSGLTGLIAGTIVDNLTSLFNVPAGALLGALLAFPLGAIPATLASSLGRALMYGAVGDTIGRGAGGIIGAIAGSLAGALGGAGLGSLLGAALAALDGAIKGAVIGGLAGAAVTSGLGGLVGALLALITHLRAGVGMDTRSHNPAFWFDGRIVNKGGFGDSLMRIPGLSGSKKAPYTAVPNVASASYNVKTGAVSTGERSLTNVNELVGV